MRMWSEGLGKIELEIDFSHYKVVTEDKDTVIKGITNEPVQWAFTASFTKEDIAGLLNILFKPKTLFFLLINLHHVFLFVYEKMFRRERYTEVTTE